MHKQGKRSMGGDPSLADPSPLKNLHLSTPVPAFVSFHVLLILCLIVLWLCLSCNKRVVTVWEQPLSEPEREQVVQMFPEEEDLSIEVQRCEPVIDAGRVYFGFDRSEVDSVGVKVVEAVAGYLRGCSGAMVKVGGYCDERGSREYNHGLGQRRAGAVSDLLVSLGVGEKQIKAISYGEGNLVVEGCEDEGCHGKNRRVEFQLEGVNK